MTDEWTLEDKKRRIKVDVRQNPDVPWRNLERLYLCKDVESVDPKYHIYKASDIETLRQKIIEDVERSYRNTDMPDQDINFIKEIINHRFGHEEAKEE